MRRLDEGYSAEVDSIGKNDWHRLLGEFQDAAFYQTWSFGASHFGEEHLSHIILKKEGAAVGMAQIRQKKVPGFPVGIAYVSWGPIYRGRDGAADERHLRNLLRAQVAEYVIKRRLFLRIVPQALAGASADETKRVYMEEGFFWSSLARQDVIVDLSPPLDTIRQNMHPKWRQSLRAAERNKLDIIEGHDSETCRLALQVIQNMKSRKQFFGGNQEKIVQAQMDLPESLRLKILVCREGLEPVATLGWVTFGTVGIPLVGATGDKALKTKASYALWWKMIEYYKTQGFAAVDLGAVNQKRNPGGYLFKTRVLGKGLEGGAHYIGQFDAPGSSGSKLVFRTLFAARELYRDVRSKF